MVYPLIYDGYPLMGSIQIRNRNTELLGLPPVKEVYLEQDKGGLSISSSGDVPNPVSFVSGSRIEYMLPQTVFSDYYDIQNQVANYIVRYPSGSSRLTSLLVNPYPLIDYGKYKIKFNYKIPGVNVVTSEYNATLIYSRN
jgi:hypothetical protein